MKKNVKVAPQHSFCFVFFPFTSLSFSDSASRRANTMCGILAALGLDSLTAEQARRLVLQASKQQRHRGPDDTSAVQLSGGADVIAFERLLIIDPTSSGRYGVFFFVLFFLHGRRVDAREHALVINAVGSVRRREA